MGHLSWQPEADASPGFRGSLRLRMCPGTDEPVKSNEAKFSFLLKSASVVFLVCLAGCPPEGTNDKDGPSASEAVWPGG